MSVILPGNAQTYSKDPRRFPMIADDAVAEWAEGPWVGIGGDRWVDLVSGMGAVILGHDHPSVTSAVLEQVGDGVAFPIPCELDTQVAEQLLSMLTWEGAESVRFGKNGADVVTSAVRLARAVTGRGAVAYFDYHGHHDWCMTEPPWNAGISDNDSDDAFDSYRIARPGHSTKHFGSGDVEGYREMRCEQELPVFHDIPAVDHILSNGSYDQGPYGLAAVVMEAVPSNDPGWERPGGWFHEIRRACDETGTLLIIDEMVTGFRMAPGGACEALGIRPDLACYGKGIANGFPLSAIVGPYKYLKRYEEDVFFSTTHGGEAVSLAAALATMRVVQEQDVPAKIAELGERILDAAGPYGMGYPQRPVFTFSKGALETMGKHGVLCGGYANLTLAHAEDVDVGNTIVEAVKDATNTQRLADKIIAELDAARA